MMKLRDILARLDAAGMLADTDYSHKIALRYRFFLLCTFPFPAGLRLLYDQIF